MKQKHWCRLHLVLGMVLASGCGGDDGALGGFSGMHVDKIEYDCQQTVQCKVQNGETIAENPLEKCIDDTADVLEASAEKQMEFLANFARCQAFVVCDYRTCAINDAQGSYGATQMDKVVYNCQQDVECRRQLGMLGADPTTELNNCVASNVGFLDTLDTAQRMHYEAEFARCSAQQACPFTDCFPY